jgi:hypothetical protein
MRAIILPFVLGGVAQPIPAALRLITIEPVERASIGATPKDEFQLVLGRREKTISLRRWMSSVI